MTDCRTARNHGPRASRSVSVHAIPAEVHCQVQSIPETTERTLVAMTRTFVAAGVTLLSLLAAGSAVAQKQIVLERRDATVTLEPYAPNVVRITMSLKKDARPRAARLRHLGPAVGVRLDLRAHRQGGHLSLGSHDGEDAGSPLRSEDHEVRLRHLPVFLRINPVDPAHRDRRRWQTAGRSQWLVDDRPES